MKRLGGEITVVTVVTRERPDFRRDVQAPVQSASRRYRQNFQRVRE
jgi:hypothetical protein